MLYLHQLRNEVSGKLTQNNPQRSVNSWGLLNIIYTSKWNKTQFFPSNDIHSAPTLPSYFLILFAR